MNNKGFTLVEVLSVLVIMTIIFVITINVTGNTLSISNEEAYKLTKDNIIEATDKYILECNNNIIDCNLDWNNNKTIISAKKLIEAGYFKELKNPINNKDLSNCLTIEVEQTSNNNNYNINDNNCK